MSCVIEQLEDQRSLNKRGKFLHSEIETLPRPQLERLQLKRVRWQIKRCYRESEFYREKFKRANVRPSDIRSLNDIRKIPVIRKDELRDEQLRYPPFGRYVLCPQDDWSELHPSTGTTGSPVNTIWSKSDCEYITEVTARTMWSFGVRPSDIIQNGFSYGLWVAGLSVHYGAKKIGAFIVPVGATMTERHIDYLLHSKSTVLLSTPSLALYIAEKMREKTVRPEDTKLRIGGFGGEAGTETPATRHKIEEGLGIDAYDYYGLAEIGPTFASECTEKAGLHWSEDQHLVEVVDPDTLEPLGPGETGVLVITHLTKEATPMIRYFTNDYAKVELNKCACGRTHARSPGGILGRADDMVIFRGAKFYPVQVEKVVRSFPELSDEYRIQLSTNEATGLDSCKIIVEYVGDDSMKQKFEDTLLAALKAELQVTPGLELCRPETLERTTFKAKRILDLRKSHTS